jgi:hypothetical protein
MVMYPYELEGNIAELVAFRAGVELFMRSGSMATKPNALARLRKLCLALPEAHEAEAWGSPTFRVRNKMFAMYAAANNHHGAGRPAVWCKATPDNQELMVGAEPTRYFVPAYVGPSGWVGVWLDGKCDWGELALLLREGYRLVAPKRLVSSLTLDRDQG